MTRGFQKHPRSRSDHGSQWPALQRNPADFANEKTKGQCNQGRHPEDFPSFCPTGISNCHLSPSHFRPTLPHSPALLEPRNCPGSQPGLPRFMSAGYFTGLLQLTPHYHACTQDEPLQLCTSCHWPDTCHHPPLQCTPARRLRNHRKAQWQHPGPSQMPLGPSQALSSVTGLRCHALWQNPENRVTHTDHQGSSGYQNTHSWPQPMLPALGPTGTCVSATSPPTTQVPAAGPQSRVYPRQWLWSCPVHWTLRHCRGPQQPVDPTISYSHCQ